MYFIYIFFLLKSTNILSKNIIIKILKYYFSQLLTMFWFVINILVNANGISRYLL